MGKVFVGDVGFIKIDADDLLVGRGFVSEDLASALFQRGRRLRLGTVAVLRPGRPAGDRTAGQEDRCRQAPDNDFRVNSSTVAA
jgi:hypothetical protein